MKECVLSCKNIYKNKSKEILKNISFNLYKGDILGLVGPNGAGKTTLIKIILGLENISKGSVIINGYGKKDFKNYIGNVGAIVENPVFYNYLSGRDNLKLRLNMYKHDDDFLNYIIKLVGLESRIDDKVYKYSLGMQERLGIALALINNPNILILDEPTNGLDTSGIIFLKNLLKELSKKGVSIIISSHMLKELDDICNRICIIKDGILIEDLNVLNEECFIFEIDNTDDINILFKNEILDKNKFKVWCNKEFIPIVTESIISNGNKVYSVNRYKPSIEDIFLDRVGVYDKVN